MITVKATLQDVNEIRRFTVGSPTTSFDKLHSKVKTLFNLKDDNFTMAYMDEDNEWVTMSSSSDAKHAFKLAKPCTLRLRIRVQEAQAPAVVKKALMQFEAELTKHQQEAQQKAMEHVAKKAAASYHKTLAPLVQPSLASRSCSHCAKPIPSECLLVSCSECPEFAVCEPCLPLVNHGHPLLSASSNALYECDFCESVIHGTRHNCATCKDFDLCHMCFTLGEHAHDPSHHFATHQPRPLQKAPKSKKQAAPSALRHVGIICDSCDKDIVGVRYKCGHCSNYDLCEACEPSAPDFHDPAHIFVKVRKPVSLGTEIPLLYRLRPCACSVSSGTQSPSYVPVGLSRSSSAADAPSIISSISTISRASSCTSTSNNRCVLAKPEALSSSRPILSAKFVNDMNLRDGSLVEGGRVIRKMWKMLNDGRETWPNGTMLQSTTGVEDRLRCTDVFLPATKPGSFVTVSTWITVPQQPGRYRTEFQLHTPQGHSFGDDLWVDIVAVPPTQPFENSMVYPTLSTTSPDSRRSSASNDFGSVIRREELLDDDISDDDDDPFMDPSITSYTPSRRLSNGSIDSSTDDGNQDAAEQHGTKYEQQQQQHHRSGSSSRASPDGFIVIDNLVQNPHEKTPPQATTPPPPPPQAAASPVVTGPYDTQMRQIHEMGLTFCDELAIRLLSEYDGNVDRAVPEILERLYPE